MIQNKYNDNEDIVTWGTSKYRLNDKILQLKNLVDDNVFNGDLGNIASYDYIDDKLEIACDFSGNYVTYNKEDLDKISLAYCISIHKSQGSEYPIVIIPIIKDNLFMMDKRLLYTAITRCYKSLILIGSKQVFYQALQVDENKVRRTYLKDMLHKTFNY
ncbi:MAG: ATP-binding domain-containing protein [Erysipelotrichaceae bacterium]